MISAPLMTAVAAGAGAIARTAGTGLWTGIRPRIEEWFARLGEGRARALGTQLDATVKTLKDTPEEGDARKDMEMTWTIRLQDILLELDETERTEFAGFLTRLRDEVAAARTDGGASAGDHSVVAGGDINVNASDGAVAVLHNEGGFQVNPPRPGPDTEK